VVIETNGSGKISAHCAIRFAVVDWATVDTYQLPLHDRSFKRSNILLYEIGVTSNS
jgi:hypothetical protein